MNSFVARSENFMHQKPRYRTLVLVPVLFAFALQSAIDGASPTPHGPEIPGPVPGRTVINRGTALPSRITDVSPAKARAPSTYKVTVSISSYTPTLLSPNAVFFTGASGKQDVPGHVLATTNSSIDVTVPAEAKTGKIVVTLGPFGTTLTSSFDFIVLTNPVFTGFSPATATRGSTVTIKGSGFAQWDNFSLTFSNCADNRLPHDCEVTSDQIKNRTDTSLDFVVPMGAKSGSVKVHFSTTSLNDQGDITPSPQLTVNVPLELDSMDHYKGVQGTSVTLYGMGFRNQPDFSVYFTGVAGYQSMQAQISPAPTFDRQCTVIVPSTGVTGKIMIVSGPLGFPSAVFVKSTFDFKVIGPLQVSYPTPASGLPGTTLRIWGSGFLDRDDLSVLFWNGLATNESATIVEKTGDHLDVIVPDLATGSHPIKVSSPANEDKSLEVVDTLSAFTVSTPTPTPTATLPPLQVTGLSPESAPRGATVRITGANFLKRSSLMVQFCYCWPGSTADPSVNAKIVTQTNDYVDVVVPDNAGGTGKVRVMSFATGGGAEFETVDTPMSFTVTEPQFTVIGVSPQSAPRGTTVEITGSNFLKMDWLWVSFWNGINAASKVGTIWLKKDDRIEVTVPGGAQTGKIEVWGGTNNGWVNESVEIPTFTVLDPPTAVTGLSPESGLRGSTVRIMVKNVLAYDDYLTSVYSSTGVNFWGWAIFPNQVATIISKTNDYIDVIVPDTAQTGKIQVWGGSGVFYYSLLSPVSFTVIEPPVQVNAISPDSAPRGAVVRITGANFQNWSDVQVYFCNCVVDSSGSPNQAGIVITRAMDYMDVVVPDGATGTGKVQVIYGTGGVYKTVDAPMPFTVGSPTPSP